MSNKPLIAKASLLVMIVSFFFYLAFFKPSFNQGIIGLVLVLVAYLAWAIYAFYPFNRGWFYNGAGERVEEFDIVIDAGNTVRAAAPGVLKKSKEESDYWLIVWDDGFEWPISNKQNVLHYKKKK